ncbi:phosphoribosyl-AMP cyclohydrolase [compost metagenome]
MVVRQTGRGAACHTGRKSCFYRRVMVVEGEAQLQDTGLPRLFDPKAVYGG